jgi:hypothetical protein
MNIEATISSMVGKLTNSTSDISVITKTTGPRLGVSWQLDTSNLVLSSSGAYQLGLIRQFLEQKVSVEL